MSFIRPFTVWSKKDSRHSQRWTKKRKTFFSVAKFFFSFLSSFLPSPPTVDGSEQIIHISWPYTLLNATASAPREMMKIPIDGLLLPPTRPCPRPHGLPRENNSTDGLSGPDSKIRQDCFVQVFVCNFHRCHSKDWPSVAFYFVWGRFHCTLATLSIYLFLSLLRSRSWWKWFEAFSQCFFP